MTPTATPTRAAKPPQPKQADRPKRRPKGPPPRMRIELKFTEPLLGTATANPELFEQFIASKQPDAAKQGEEIDALPDVDEEVQRATTVFSRDDAGRPALWDYQIKGFFKDACGMLRRVRAAANGSGKLKAYKREIDGLVFVFPRRIPLLLPDGAELTTNQRPLRAQTAQGERVSLARSEEAPVGTRIRFEVECLDPDRLEPLVEEWLSYGSKRGLGQWRNASWGRFTWRPLAAETD